MSQDDLQKLMKAIQQLSASGNREQAAQMLAMLQNMLENLHMTKGGSGGKGRPAEQGAQRGDPGIGDLMGKQRGLLDKTMRQQQGKGDPKDGGAARPGAAAGRTAARSWTRSMQKLDPKTGRRRWARPARRWTRRSNALSQQDLANASNAQKNALDADAQGRRRAGQADAGQRSERPGRAGTIRWAAGRSATATA